MDEMEKKQTAEVVGEDIGQREEYSKRFRMTDGSWLAVAYPEAVHFDENGKWVEIDNRLVVKSIESGLPSFPRYGQAEAEEQTERTNKNAYVNTRNRFGVTLPVELDESSWIGVSDHGHSLFFRIEGISPSDGKVEKEPGKTGDALRDAIQVHLSSRLLYSEVQPGVDLRYVVNGQKLKENFIFSSLEAVPEQLNYVIWAEGMHAKVIEDGTILFLAKEEPTFQLPAPFLMDADGMNGGKISVELKELEAGLYRLQYTPEREWLEAEARVWPVTLDPVIYFTSGSSYTQDTYISSGFPSSNFYQQNYLRAGYFRTSYENYKKTRALIKFQGLPSFGSGDVITTAILEVRGVPVTACVNTYTQVNAYAVTESWASHTATWNNQPSHESRLQDFQLVDKSAYKFYHWNVTDAVQRWHGGAAAQGGLLTNQGFILTSPAETGTSIQYALFDSSEGSYLPVLLIEYRNMTGLEKYWDYTSASAGRAGMAYVHNYTGNLVVSRSDMSYSGNRMPAAVTFTYNQSDTTVNIGYGLGWRSNYSQIVEYTPVGQVEYYRWTDGDGTKIYFSLVSGHWIDETGQGYMLTKNFVGSSFVGYSISDRDNNILGFDANGRLTSVTDKLGNSLSVSYTQNNSSNLRISQITDGAGRKYHFSYENGLLSLVEYYGVGSSALERQYVNYTYSSNRLTTVTYADEKSAAYSFNGVKLTQMKDIQRADGTRNIIKATYAGDPTKVTQLAYYDGTTLVSSSSFLYGDHFTTVTDNTGRWCTYHFNDYGNTMSVYNQAGQAVYGTYATDTNSSGRANQLLKRSRLQDTVVNLLSSSQRSRAGSWTDQITVQSGETYTLSGTAEEGVTLNLSAGSTTGTSTSIGSSIRTEVTITIPPGATTLTFSGSDSCIDLQLEVAKAASRYNLLSNTDMDSLTNWVGTNTGAGDIIGVETGARAHLDTNALKITGDPSKKKRFSNTVAVSGSAGDEYTFGGWIKSNSVPLSNVNTPGSSQKRKCGIMVRLFNEDTQISQNTVYANTACSEWQFLSTHVRAPSAYTKVEYSFVYDYNENTSWFDGAQLFLEKYSYIYTYDDQGRVLTVTDLKGQVTEYEYRGNTSDITKIRFPGGSEYTYTYSNNGLLLSAVSATGVTTAYTYNAWGSPTGTTIGNTGTRKLTSATTYTSDGNMTASVTSSNGNTTTYQNDTDKSLVTKVTDPSQHSVNYSYDAMRRPTVIAAASSCEITNTYADDLLVKIRHNNVGTNYTEFNLAYTKADLLSSVKVNNAYTLVQNSYDTSGTWTMSKQSYGNSTAWNYEYNDFDQPTRRWTTGGSTGVEFLYFYNNEGALARVEQYSTTLSGGEVTARTLVTTARCYYDTINRLTCVRETDADGSEHAFRWTYDSSNNVTELVETIDGESFTYTNSYNGDQQPTQSGYGSVNKSFTYDGLGRLSQTTVTCGNTSVLTTGYSYKDWRDDRTTTQVASLQNSYGNTQETFSYTYDEKGNIDSVTTSDSDGTHTTSYSYNFLNEMEWEIDVTAGKAWKYVSDKVGNMRSKTEYDYQNGQPSNPVVVASYDYGDSNWPDLLTSYIVDEVGKTLQTYSITYDGIGNPLSYRDWTFTWQGGRQLATASNDSTSLSFVYNESGLRIKKTVVIEEHQEEHREEHRYVYRGSTLVAEITDNYALYFHHDAKGSPVGFTYKEGNNQDVEYFYRKNLQGDIVGIVDASGVSKAKYLYDAWGRILEVTGDDIDIAAKNPLRYRGYYYDSECALYYLHSRYYDPETCRFINADDTANLGADNTILSHNLYAYCGNNPVIGLDPSGAFFFTALGAVSGFVGSFAVSLLCGNDISTAIEDGAAGAVGGAIAGAGIDVGLLILGTGGAAAPFAAFAIAYAFGGVGNIVTETMTSEEPLEPVGYIGAFIVGGTLNCISLATGLGCHGKTMLEIARKGSMSFAENAFIGTLVATATGIATAIALLPEKRGAKET